MCPRRRVKPTRRAFAWRRRLNRCRRPWRISTRPLDSVRTWSRPIATAAWQYRLAQCEAVLATLEDAVRKLPSAAKGASSDQALPPQSLDRALVDGRRAFEKAVNRLVDAKEQAALIAAEKKDIASAEDAMVKNCIAAALARGDAAARERKKADVADPDKTDLSTLGKKLRELRNEAVAINQRIDRDAQKAAQALVAANAELAASCDALNNSRNLQQAKRSAAPRVRRPIIPAPKA